MKHLPQTSLANQFPQRAQSIEDLSLSLYALRVSVFSILEHLSNQLIEPRRIFSILRPFANSSTSLSKYRTFWVKGFSMSSTR
jgi:hypothetical protein